MAAGIYDEVLWAEVGARLVPLKNTSVTVKNPDGTNATLYTDTTGTTTVAQPIASDGKGNLRFFAKLSAAGYDIVYTPPGQAQQTYRVRTVPGDPVARLAKTADRVLYISGTGVDTADGLSMGTAKRTLAAALTAMGNSKGKIHALDGVYDVGPTLSLSGRACGIIGNGDGTIFRASAQTGPVLNFAGYLWPSNASDVREFANFRVEGDNTAGIAKKGINFPTTAEGTATGIVFRNFSVANTGGIALDLGALQLSHFQNFTLNAPVDATLNNVPWMRGLGPCNGNTFLRMGLRSVVATANVGAVGAVVLEDDGTYAPHFNEFIAPWVEYLHVPTGGCLFHIKGASNIIHGVQFFDQSKVTGATGTAYIRFSAPAVSNNGGNIVTGEIPGKGTAANDIDCGVEILQSRNKVDGVKGFSGTNVILGVGVQGCDVTLKGQMSGTIGSAVGVVDNSGNYDNNWDDSGAGEIVRGSLRMKRNTNGALEISRRDGGAPGVDFGSSSGARIFSTTGNKALFSRAAVHYFQSVAGTTMAQVQEDAGVADGATALLLRRNVGGTFSLQQVTMGAADSGGVGFKVLRVPN